MRDTVDTKDAVGVGIVLLVLAFWIGASIGFHCDRVKVDPDLLKIQRQRDAMRLYEEAGK